MAELKVRVWIEKQGECVVGDGRARLLTEIERHGSINAAAQALGMSYRNAWSHLQKMERRLGKPLLKRGRGGSCLTAFAKRLLAVFYDARKDIEIAAAKHSGSLRKRLRGG